MLGNQDPCLIAFIQQSGSGGPRDGAAQLDVRGVLKYNNWNT